MTSALLQGAELRELHARAGGRWIVHEDGTRTRLDSERLWSVVLCSQQGAEAMGAPRGRHVLVQAHEDLDRPLLRRMRVFCRWAATVVEGKRWAGAEEAGDVTIAEVVTS